MTQPSAPLVPDLPPLDGEAPAGALDSPPARRNAVAVLEALRRALPPTGTVLEIGCGPGQHAAAFAHALAPRGWLPTDPSPEAVASAGLWRAAVPEGRARPEAARLLDVTAAPDAWPVSPADQVRALFSANVIHIAPPEVMLALIEGAAHHLPAQGRLLLYGPFRRDGAFSGDGDVKFDAWLREKDPRFGIRCLDQELRPGAEAAGFALVETAPMPANNLLVVFQKS